MARTPSNMIPLGTVAPDFFLPDTVSGSMVGLKDLAGSKGTLVMFICNHCPFVKHVNPELVRISRDYREKGIRLVAISSNDVAGYPQDGPLQMAAMAGECGYDFPYLYDEDQSVARAYDAACTPDFFLFNGGLELVYRGQLDPSRPGNGITLTGMDMRNALDALVAGRPLDTVQYPSIGCNIKWKV
jgi:thiol-disulfide isomerase/thioredoxin